MKTKKKKPTIKEVAYNLDVSLGEINQLKIRTYTQAKLFSELITFLGKETEFKEHLKKTYIPEKMKNAEEKQDTQKSK
tara:strand:- start:385 stop:618 length:234 start_codon:yes stop_codon:yes gene_type:complete